MNFHILHCDETVWVHFLCMQTTLILAGMCVALSNFSSVLLPCLYTSNHTQHAITHKATTHKFSPERMSSTMYDIAPLSWTEELLFLLSVSQILPSSPCVCWNVFASSSYFAFLNTYLFRLSNHSFWGTQLWLSILRFLVSCLAYSFSRLSQHNISFGRNFIIRFWFQWIINYLCFEIY